MGIRSAKFAADQLVVCVESFASSDPEHGSCRAGIRLRGSHPTVQKRPQYFIDAGASEDEIQAMRNKIYTDAGAPAPVRS
jgi:hypothetical protein